MLEAYSGRESRPIVVASFLGALRSSRIQTVGHRERRGAVQRALEQSANLGWTTHVINADTVNEINATLGTSAMGDETTRTEPDSA